MTHRLTDPMSTTMPTPIPTGTASAPNEPTTYIRSTEMQSMHEALARDRMREAELRAQSARLAHDLAAQRRWHRVSRYALRAEQRHANRLGRSAAWR